MLTIGKLNNQQNKKTGLVPVFFLFREIPIDFRFPFCYNEINIKTVCTDIQEDIP